MIDPTLARCSPMVYTPWCLGRRQVRFGKSWLALFGQLSPSYLSPLLEKVAVWQSTLLEEACFLGREGVTITYHAYPDPCPLFPLFLCVLLFPPKTEIENEIIRNERTNGFTILKKVDAIDSSTPAGRERLKKIVATLLNSYLAQLLESGFLHADPHP